MSVLGSYIRTAGSCCIINMKKDLVIVENQRLIYILRQRIMGELRAEAAL